MGKPEAVVEPPVVLLCLPPVPVFLGPGQPISTEACNVTAASPLSEGKYYRPDLWALS